MRDEDARFADEFGSVFGDLGFDPIDVVTDVDAIDDSLFVGVVLDEVSAEETDRLLGRTYLAGLPRPIPLPSLTPFPPSDIRSFP